MIFHCPGIEYDFPNTYIKQVYCVSCAVHRKTVRCRARDDRKIRVIQRGLFRKYKK